MLHPTKYVFSFDVVDTPKRGRRSQRTWSLSYKYKQEDGEMRTYPLAVALFFYRFHRNFFQGWKISECQNDNLPFSRNACGKKILEPGTIPKFNNQGFCDGVHWWSYLKVAQLWVLAIDPNKPLRIPSNAERNMLVAEHLTHEGRRVSRLSIDFGDWMGKLMKTKSINVEGSSLVSEVDQRSLKVLRNSHHIIPYFFLRKCKFNHIRKL